MKTNTTNRKNYEKPSIEVVKFSTKLLLLVDSDEYYYQGAPDD
jgi:hypothetical protein